MNNKINKINKILKKYYEEKVLKDPYIIFSLNNPSEELIIKAILSNPKILENTYNDDTDDYENIFNIYKISYNVQKKVLEQNPFLVNKIKNLHPKLKEKYKNIIIAQNIGLI